METPPTPKTPQITEEEIERPITETIAKEAARIYRETTGKKPPKKIPDEFYVKAMAAILDRWQKTLREIKFAVTGIFGRPRISVFEELPEEPKIAVLTCPRCREKALKRQMPGIWVCFKCGYSLAVPRWFPRPKEVIKP